MTKKLPRRNGGMAIKKIKREVRRIGGLNPRHPERDAIEETL